MERSSGRRKKFIPPTYRFNCRNPLRFLFPVYFPISSLRCFLSLWKIDKHLTPATKLLKSHHKTNNRSTSWNHRTTASMRFPEAADVWRWWSTSGRVDAFRVAGSRLASASPFVYLQRFHSIIFLSATRFPSHFSPFLDISSLPRTNKGDGPRKNKWGSKSKGSVAPPLPIFPSLFLDNTSFFLHAPPPSFSDALWAALCSATSFIFFFPSLFQTYPASNPFSSCWTARRANWDSWTSQTRRWATAFEFRVLAGGRFTKDA